MIADDFDVEFCKPRDITPEDSDPRYNIEEFRLFLYELGMGEYNGDWDEVMDITEIRND